jgi:hypothetical protein
VEVWKKVKGHRPQSGDIFIFDRAVQKTTGVDFLVFALLIYMKKLEQICFEF